MDKRHDHLNEAAQAAGELHQEAKDHVEAQQKVAQQPPNHVIPNPPERK